MPAIRPAANNRASGIFIEEDGSASEPTAYLRETLKKDAIPEELSCNNKILKMAEYFAHPIKYLSLRFFSGMFFTLGACAALLIIIIAVYFLKDLSLTKLILKKALMLSKILGRS